MPAPGRRGHPPPLRRALRPRRPLRRARPRLQRQRASLRALRARRVGDRPPRRAIGRRSSTRTTGRRALAVALVATARPRPQRPRPSSRSTTSRTRASTTAASSRHGPPRGGYSFTGVEFYGDVGYLKAGLVYADALTTVSPTYAREIQTPEFGRGLDGVLRRGEVAPRDRERHRRRRVGPRDRRGAPGALLPRRPRRAARSREALLAELGLDGDLDAPLSAWSRASTRRRASTSSSRRRPSSSPRARALAILGTGDPGLEHRLAELAAREPEQGRGAPRLRQQARAPLLRRLRPLARPFALRAVRAQPALLDALRLGADRAAGPAASTTPSRRRREPDRGTGFVFGQPTAAALPRGVAPRAHGLRRQGALRGDPEARHVARRRVGRAGARVRAALRGDQRERRAARIIGA